MTGYLRAATTPQTDLIKRLHAERELPACPADSAEARLMMLAALVAEDRHIQPGRPPVSLLTTTHASEVITWLFTLARKAPAAPAGAETLQDRDEDQGVYRKDGKVFIVKLSRGGHLYAQRLTEATGARLSEAGTVTRFDREYAPGVARELTTADKMPLADARELMARYGRCLYCSHSLKAADSVARMVGPVCAKRFAA